MAIGPPDGSVDMDHTAARVRALGIDWRLRQRFPCTLPGHRGHEAKLHPTAAGHWRFECFELEERWGLAEVRAFAAYGRVRHGLSPVQIARWRERLDYEAGLLVPRPVSALELLPPDAPDALRRVAAGWALLVGLRDMGRWGDEPFTFAREFVMAYCEVTDRQAGHSVRRLERLGVMRRAPTQTEGSRQPILWVPGG